MKKKPLSRSEWHTVITSYGGLALSVIAIILSCISMYQSDVTNNREIIQILNIKDDGYYHFDGEKIYKNYNITIANNSAVPVSVVKLDVDRDGEKKELDGSNLGNILPLNLEENHATVITFQWEIPLKDEYKTYIDDALQTRGGQNNGLDFPNSDILFPTGNRIKDYLIYNEIGSAESQGLVQQNKDFHDWLNDFWNWMRVPVTITAKASTAKGNYFTSDYEDYKLKALHGIYSLSRRKVIEFSEGDIVALFADADYENFRTLRQIS